MGDHDDANLHAIIATLERLATVVEAKSRTDPHHLDRVLDDAVSTTSTLIRQALPHGHDVQPWISELSSFAAAAPTDTAAPACAGRQSVEKEGQSPSPCVELAEQSTEPSSRATAPTASSSLPTCPCPVDDVPTRLSKVPLPSASYVRCIHGCGTAFCTASCRKQHLRTHRPQCPALARKKLLASIGLPPPSSDSELF